jgi:hypothetical protein
MAAMYRPGVCGAPRLLPVFDMALILRVAHHAKLPKGLTGIAALSSWLG